VRADEKLTAFIELESVIYNQNPAQAAMRDDDYLSIPDLYPKLLLSESELAESQAELNRARQQKESQERARREAEHAEALIGISHRNACVENLDRAEGRLLPLPFRLCSL
jgi:hypothetical protein